MQRLRLPNGSPISIQLAGDGFPLVLVPGPEGEAPWLPHIPLLSELCQTIVYEGCQPQPAVELLRTVLDGLHLKRVYLASPLPEWLATLEFARLYPQYLEAVLFVEFPGSREGPSLSDSPPAMPAPDVTLPALFLLADDNGPSRAAADRISVHLSNCRIVALGRSAPCQADLPSTPKRQFPHLMMRFLLDRERHRNLVWGASFLL